MTRNDAIAYFKRHIELYCVDGISREAEEMAIKSLEFVEWVAEEIFSDDWEFNKDSFEEVACRKLAKLGIVRAKGNEWELVEPQESEVGE